MAIIDVKEVSKNIVDKASQYITGHKSVGGIVPIAYPSTLDSNIHDSYLVFYAVKPVGTAGGLSVKGIGNRQLDSVKGKFAEDLISVIQLYVPNMVETLNHSYDTNEVGLIQDLANAVQGDLTGAIHDIQNGNYSGLADHGMGIAKGAVGVGVGAAKKFLSRATMETNTQTTGTIMGDRNIVLYKGTSPRSQTFTFYLSPRNKDELISIANIKKLLH